MEDVVYTLPEDPDAEKIPFIIKNKHLPKADASSGKVTFRSVTPKQQFIMGPDATEQDMLDQTVGAAMRHRELAEDHLAASLWLSQEAPIRKAPKPRKEMSVSKQVTIPTDHRHIEANDFHTARSAAGVYKGNYAVDVFYLGTSGVTGDGRQQHTFEVTYYWSEVADD